MADLSFQQVVKELGITEDELKRMVADNEIRAFREADELTFKREDVDKLKERLENAPTIVLDDTDTDSILGEPYPEKAESQEEGKPQAQQEEQKEAPAEQAPQQQEETTEEVQPAASEQDAAPSEEDTVLSVDGLLEEDAGVSDEGAKGGGGEAPELETGDDTVLDSGLVEDEDLSLGELEDTEKEGLVEEEAGPAGPRPVRATRHEAHPVMTAAAVITSVLLVIPGAILVNLAAGQNGVFPDWIQQKLSFLNGLIDSLVGMF